MAERDEVFFAAGASFRKASAAISLCSIVAPGRPLQIHDYLFQRLICGREITGDHTCRRCGKVDTCPYTRAGVSAMLSGLPSSLANCRDIGELAMLELHVGWWSIHTAIRARTDACWRLRCRTPRVVLLRFPVGAPVSSSGRMTSIIIRVDKTREMAGD